MIRSSKCGVSDIFVCKVNLVDSLAKIMKEKGFYTVSSGKKSPQYTAGAQFVRDIPFKLKSSNLKAWERNCHCLTDEHYFLSRECKWANQRNRYLTVLLVNIVPHVFFRPRKSFNASGTGDGRFLFVIHPHVRWWLKKFGIHWFSWTSIKLQNNRLFSLKAVWAFLISKHQFFYCLSMRHAQL